MLTVHSLTLDHVAGVDHARLELPDTGVVVVHGPNESGKSTLLTAFRLLLDDVPVSSRAGRVRALKSATEDVATTVTADLTVAGRRLTVLKSYNKGGGRCELTVTAPQRENLTGRQAAERFAELLAEGVDTDLVRALTVEQGASLDVLSAAGIGSLEKSLSTGDSGAAGDADASVHAASAASSGSPASSGDGAAALIARIGEEYARYHTPSGRPARELVAATTARDEAAADHTTATERYAQAQHLIGELERLTAEKSAVQKQEPEAVAEAGRAAEELTAGRAAVAELDRYRDAVTVARGARDIAVAQTARRTERIRDLGEATTAVDTLTEEVRAVAEAAEQETTAAGDLRDRLSAARHRSWVAKSWAAWLTARDREQEARARADSLADRETRAAEIADRVREAGEDLRDNPVTDRALDALRTAESALRRAVGVRDAVATTVTVTGPADREVSVDGEPRPLTDGTLTVHATGPRVVGVGDCTVTVTPSRDVSDLDEDVTRARTALDRQLADLDVTDLTAAEDAAARRRDLTDRLRDLELTLAQVTGDTTLADLRAALDRAGEEAEALATATADALARVREEDPEGAVDLPGVPVGAAATTPGTDPGAVAGEVTATAADLTAASDAAARDAERLQEDLDRVTRAGAAVRLESRRAELDRATAARDRLTDALVADRADTGDADLETAAQDRQDALDAAEQDLAEAQDRVGVVDLGMLENLADGAAARVQRLRDRAAQTGHAVSRVTGALGEHTGVADDVETTRATLERADRECRAVTARAEAAALLYRTVQDALTAARERYEAPLRATVERLARTLYGTPVHIGFDEDLSVSGRTLDGVTLETDRLSGGAREQLSVLTRLAVADLVGGGDAVPVIIDDALGFSDRGRAGRMNAVLATLGRDHQIIVLTCDVDRFENVAGAEFVTMTEVRGQ